GDLMLAQITTRGGTGVAVCPPTVTGTWTSVNRTNSTTTFGQEVFRLSATAADVAAASYAFQIRTTNCSGALSSRKASGGIVAYVDTANHANPVDRPVDVIVGPGNAYVSRAKREVAGAGIVGIESPAGPSELLVVADVSAPAPFVAANLVAQAEHGPGGAVVLVTDDSAVADAVDAELARALAELPSDRRREAESTLESGGRAVVVRDLDEALAVVNAFAPEHLELMTVDPEALLPLVRNAGAVFIGPYAPTAYGDYSSGANHVLPTSGAARFSSALRVDDFRKHVHVVRADAAAASGPVARAGQVIATAEGLHAHARSFRVRSEEP
ncbi:MAG: histidinol dehydrogenase, partial [Acidimicrobiia bacterium]